MKSTLYVMIGVPGAGKSTFARNVLKNINNAMYVSRDSIRYSLDDKYAEKSFKERECVAYKEYIDQINVGLLVGDVIADATHYSLKSRKNLIKNLSLDNVDVVYVVINTPLDLCKERNALRSGNAFVSEDKIDFFHKNLELPYQLADFEKDHVKQIWWIEYK